MTQRVWKRDRSDNMMSREFGNIDDEDQIDEKCNGNVGAPAPSLKRQQGNNGSSVSVGGSVATLPTLNGHGNDSNLFRMNTETEWDERDIEQMAQEMEMEIEIQSAKSKAGTAEEAK